MGTECRCLSLVGPTTTARDADLTQGRNSTLRRVGDGEMRDATSDAGWLVAFLSLTCCGIPLVDACSATVHYIQ